MTESIPYPDINDATLTPIRVLKVLYSTNPKLFDSEDCPYTDDQKALLKGLLSGVGDGERRSFLDQGGDRHDIMQHQIALALEDMSNMDRLGNKMEQKDKLAFLKAKPGLIERLLDLQGRNSDQRAVSDFMRKMYAFIDKELDADQRTALVKALGSFIESGEVVEPAGAAEVTASPIVHEGEAGA